MRRRLDKSAKLTSIEEFLFAILTLSPAECLLRSLSQFSNFFWSISARTGRGHAIPPMADVLNLHSPQQATYSRYLRTTIPYRFVVWHAEDMAPFGPSPPELPLSADRSSKWTPSKISALLFRFFTWHIIQLFVYHQYCYNKSTFFHSSFHFDVTNSIPEHIEFFQENVEYFRQRLFEYCEGICAVQSPTSVKVILTVNREDTSLNWKTNESYALDVRTTGSYWWTTKRQIYNFFVAGSEVTAEITSDSIFGARHALETLLQLIAPYRLHGTDRRLALVMVTTARIRDKPFYKHRGLLLDTARNFLPLEVIKKQLDGMASTKLNVFHWHATDTQSFPLESRRVPQLSK